MTGEPPSSLAGDPPNAIHVPTHFYKVVVCVGRRHRSSSEQEVSSGPPTVHAGAFVFANAFYASDPPLEMGAVPLKELEEFVGRQSAVRSL